MNDNGRDDRRAPVLPKPRAASARRLVLIAEHDPRLRSCLRDWLERAGHVVVGEATNGGETLDMVRRAVPDVLLLAMTMPGLDGSYVLRSLANTPAAQVPAVVANGESDKELALAQSLGADAVLRKDSTAGELLAVVAAV